MPHSSDSLVHTINTGGGIEHLPSAAKVDYGIDPNPDFNHPNPESRALLYEHYTTIVKKGVTSEMLHMHLRAKTLHLLLGEYFEEAELKNVLVDGRVKNVYESFS
tara:strand:- start:1520 stop:1834 length:315 start_codon:yes stop_codon:yes gene_type:complete